MSLRKCLVCNRGIYRTIRGNIAGHYGGDGLPCPATGDPYEDAITEWDADSPQWSNEQEPA